MKIINEKWQQLTLHEKRFVLTGSIIATILLIYALLWAPLQRHLQQSKQTLENNRLLLRWMQNTDNKLTYFQQQQSTLKKIQAEALLSTLQHSITLYPPLNTALSTMQQRTQNTITVVFKNAPFDILATWLIHIWQQYGISVQQAAVNKTELPGLVNANILLVLK